MDDTPSVCHRAPPAQRGNKGRQFTQLLDMVMDPNRTFMRERTHKPCQLEGPWPPPVPCLSIIVPTIRNVTLTYADFNQRVLELPKTAKAHAGGVHGSGLDVHREIEVMNSSVNVDASVKKPHEQRLPFRMNRVEVSNVTDAAGLL